MPFVSTYDDLKAKIASWLGRSDLTDLIPDFIALAEEDITANVRKAVVRDTLTLTAGTDSVSLPADCAELRSLRYDTATLKFPLNVMTEVALADIRRAGNGIPSNYAVVDNVVLFELAPSDDFTMEIVYYQALVPLSDETPTNNTLVSAGRLYLYGALLEAEPYLEHDDRVALWAAKYAKAIADESNARERAELGAAPLVRRLPVVFG